MKLRRILPLLVLGIACLLIVPMNGKQSVLPSAVCDDIPSASIIHTAQDEQDAALLLIRQTQVGNPSEGVHAARQHENEIWPLRELNVPRVLQIGGKRRVIAPHP